MNKAITIGLIGFMLFLGIHHNKQNQESAVASEELQVVDFLSFTGTITELRENSILAQDKTNADNSIVFNISGDILLLDASTKGTIDAGSLEVGQEITAYYPKNTPVALSLPPLMTPKVIVANFGEQSGFVHVATFDSTLTSSDGQLKIHLGSGMTLVDRDGKPVTSLANKTLVVFYSASTRSIPAQTTPQKIIVL